MRNRFVSLIVVPVAMVALSSIAVAQTFNPHDLTGVWQREGDRGINPVVPEMTPAGLKLFNANKPSYGRPLGAPLNGEHIGRVREIGRASCRERV